MNTDATISKPGVGPARPAAAPASQRNRTFPDAPAASKPRGWRPSADFILAIAFLGDLVVIFFALSAGFWLRFDSGWIPFPTEVNKLPPPSYYAYFYLLLVGTAFLLATFAYLRLYSKHRFMRFFRTAKTVLQGTVFWLFAYLAVSLILKFDPPISRLFTLSAFGCVLVAMLLWRGLLFRLSHRECFAAQLRQRVLFVGWGREADQLVQEIHEDRRHPYEIVGCLPSPQGRLHRPPSAGVRVMGDYQHLPRLLAQRCADIVILADLHANMGEIIGLANVCEMEFAQFKVIPSYFQILTCGLRLETISGVPVLGMGELPLDRFFNRLLKRTIDVAGALAGLVLSAPLVAIFGWLVWRESPGPVFYRQVRMGKHGRNFEIVKIRSMRMDAEANGAQWAREDDPRRLGVGAFMRKWNIDEVPQFWNVLKGDMSLIGPRPERPELIEQFKHKIAHYHARHSCLPGMSGWAQVHGWRGNTSLEERIRCDIWYVENWSLGLDLRILVLTFLRQKNAY
jgi:exopolysaccharide biosynthesis polyprenyl glycosylphosphotransferase